MPFSLLLFVYLFKICLRCRFVCCYLFEKNEDLTLIMSDEAHFYLNGIVNKQNFQYWASENPRELHQRPPQIPKVTVSCGLRKCGIFGPFFFQEEETATVTSDRYIRIFEYCFFPELRRHNGIV